ncbi:MAG: YihA family ribosome biogenesis GTP-binding protein [Clostridia bacterium]|nr:YihA family ribosome biogenesis GTP-binding protein [Clostridia bacterium]MBQ5743005.1 YihA family ribosome biogenesis GTP-binding protein [Clostridia bacterium]
MHFNNAQFVTSYFDGKKIDRPKNPEVVLVGRSNVGKSSLINKLLNRKSLARVSSTPGKTISVNYYDVDGKFDLVDLPGYGFAKRPKTEQAAWGKLTEGYFSAERDIRLILMLVDLRHPPSKDDEVMFEWLMQSQTLFTVVATKADKLNKTETKKNADALSEKFGINVIPFSSLNGTGVEELQQIITDLVLAD